MGFATPTSPQRDAGAGGQSIRHYLRLAGVGPTQASPPPWANLRFNFWGLFECIPTPPLRAANRAACRREMTGGSRPLRRARGGNAYLQTTISPDPRHGPRWPFPDGCLFKIARSHRYLKPKNSRHDHRRSGCQLGQRLNRSDDRRRFIADNARAL